MNNGRHWGKQLNCMRCRRGITLWKLSEVNQEPGESFLNPQALGISLQSRHEQHRRKCTMEAASCGETFKSCCIMLPFNRRLKAYSRDDENVLRENVRACVSTRYRERWKTSYTSNMYHESLSRWSR